MSGWHPSLGTSVTGVYVCHTSRSTEGDALFSASPESVAVSLILFRESGAGLPEGCLAGHVTRKTGMGTKGVQNSINVR